MPYFRLTCTKFNFGWGSVTDPDGRWRRLQRSPDLLAGGKGADCPSPITSLLHLTSPGPLSLNTQPFGPFVQTLPHQPLNLKVIVKLRPLARLTITCKWESRDCVLFNGVQLQDLIDPNHAFVTELATACVFFITWSQREHIINILQSRDRNMWYWPVCWTRWSISVKNSLWW